MDDLLARKRALLVRSEIHRQALAVECARIQAATDWIPRVFQYARVVSPLLAVAAPLAGWLLGSRRNRRAAPPAAPPPKRSLLSKVLAGYQIARQVKPVWDGFRKTRAH